MFSFTLQQSIPLKGHILNYRGQIALSLFDGKCVCGFSVPGSASDCKHFLVLESLIFVQYIVVVVLTLYFFFFRYQQSSVQVVNSS